jgi:DNA-binding NarL/FixJ family response regulator
MINVLVVDDNGPIRKSLRHLIDTADDIEIVASATNGIEAVEKAHSYRPDIAVMDISMPLMDGIEATEHIRECCKLTRVIILSSFNDPEHIRQALDVGAKGYVLKERAANDLLESIRSVHEGKPYFSQQIAGIAESHLLRGENNSQAPATDLGA